MHLMRVQNPGSFRWVFLPLFLATPHLELPFRFPVMAAAPQCGAEQIRQITEPATPSSPSVLVRCSLVLPHPDFRISKQVIFEGAESNGITFDCGGSTIDADFFQSGQSVVVRSALKADGTWSRPENVTIRNCRIHGAVRVYGMARNGEGERLRETSRSPGHTERVQNAAPRGIVLDRLTIIGRGSIPLIFLPA